MLPHLRAIFAAALVIALFNAALPRVLSLFYDIGYANGRVSSDFTTYDPLSIDDMLAAADRAGGRNVFWIGDSIVHGRVPPIGDSPRLLEIELQRRYGADVHVFNAALPAARTGDKYAVLLRVLDHHPAAIVFEFKYLEFSRAQVDGVPFRYPYLNRVVAGDSEYVVRAATLATNALVPLDTDGPTIGDSAARIVDHVFSVVRFRTLIQQIAFRGDLFARLGGRLADSPLPAHPPALGSRVLQPPNVASLSAARDPANFTPAYRSGPFDVFPNAGLFFAERVMRTLERSGVPAVTYLAAINHQLVDPLASDDLFRYNRGIVLAQVQDHGVRFVDYDAALPDDADFLDTEHLTPTGHRVFVDRLLRDNDDIFARALGG